MKTGYTRELQSQRRLEDNFGNQLISLTVKLSKPVLVFNDVGEMHEPLNSRLKATGVPVFRTCGEAMAVLTRYISYRLELQKLRTGK